MPHSILVVDDDDAFRGLVIRILRGCGFSLTRQLCRRPWPMRVVLFSSDADRTHAAAAVRAGAIGFVPKDEMTGRAMRRLVEHERGGCDGNGGP